MLTKSSYVFRRIPTKLYIYNSLLVNSNYHIRFNYFSISKYSTSNNDKENKSKPISRKNDDVFKPSEVVDINKTQENLDVSKLADESKKSLWIKFKDGVSHYWHGFVLLYSEIKITLNILNKMTMGKTLTRKERKQLIRTSADLFRLVPFTLFIIIPFMEFLLPFYVKYFPKMMPSTFRDKDIEKNQMKDKMSRKMELAKYLQDTLQEIGRQKSYSNKDINFNTFTKFMTQVREQGLTANTEDILKFSSLFEDTITLESLHHHHLVALCKLLGINSVGPSTLLRLELKMKVRFLEIDDKMIHSDNIDHYPVWELQDLCRERGMRSIGVGEQRLRYQLRQWLDLHLEKRVPITLLLLTRIMYLPDTLTTEEQLQQAILSLPSRAKSEAELVVTDDNKSRLQAIKDAQEEITIERMQEKEQEEATTSTTTTTIGSQDTAPIIKSAEQETHDPATVMPADAATGIKAITFDDVSKQLAEKTSPQLSPEITKADLSQIESAIVSLKESDEAIQQIELQTIKASSEEITRKLSVQPVVPEDQMVTDESTLKSARLLGNKLDTILSDIDSLMDNLYEEKTDLMKDIKSSESEMVDIEGEKERQLLEDIQLKKDELIDINDLMLALKKLQKVSDDVKMQQILHVLDDNKDGMLHSEQVLQVIKLLSEENVKLSGSELSKVMEMLNKDKILKKIDLD